MPVVASYENLKKWGGEARAQEMYRQALKVSAKKESTTFLSHSSKDDDLVPGVVLILRNHGAEVYVDHADSSIQGNECVEIANHLRKTIGDSKKFILLATPRSKESNWIPWELGLADGLKSERNVALFPAAESLIDTDWSEREFLGLYQRIVIGKIQGKDDFRWLVWNHRSNTASLLQDWIASI